MSACGGTRRIAVGACWALLLALPAHAEVVVQFVEPERYADAAEGGYGSQPSEVLLRELERYLKDLGARNLARDQTLRIDILDVDLAGRYEPWRPAAYQVRIFTEVTWPRFKVRYALERGRQVVRAGEQTLSDLNYLDRAALTSPGDPLRYERPMLESWLRSVAEVR